MKNWTKLLAVTVLSCLLPELALAQDAVTLRYLPGKEPLIYRKTQKLKQTQAFMDKKINTEVNNTDVSTWSISQGANKDRLEIKTENKSLHVKMNITGAGDYVFDSSKNDNEKGSALGAALTPLYERLSGASISLVLTPQGKLVQVQGLKELLGDVLKDNPLAAQFAAGGSEEGARLGLAEFVPMLSEKPVSPGHRWETPFEVSLDKFGKATGKTTYIYEGESEAAGRKTAKITSVTELSFDLDLDMGAAKVKGSLAVTQSKGTIHFDPKQGCVVSLNKEYTIAGNLNVTVGDKNIPVAMEQVQTVTMELLDKLPK